MYTRGKKRKKCIQDEIDEKLEKGDIDDFVSRLRRGIRDPRISQRPYAISFEESSYKYMEKYDDAPTFVVICPSPHSLYFRSLERSIVERMIDLGLPLKPLVVYASSETDFYALAQIIRDSIEIKAKSILIPLGNVIDESGNVIDEDVEKSLKKAASEKIDLIFLHIRPVPKIKSIKLLGSDNFEAGILLAKEICDQIGGKGLVILGRGIRSKAGSDRIKGMKSVFRNYSKVDIYEIPEEEWEGKDWDLGTAYDIMAKHWDAIRKKIEKAEKKLKKENLLDKINGTKKPKGKPLVAVATINDAGGEGAARLISVLYGVKSAEISKLCPIVSNDLTVRGRYLVDKGVLAGTVDGFMKHKGKLIADACIKRYYNQTNYSFVDILKPRVYKPWT